MALLSRVMCALALTTIRNADTDEISDAVATFAVSTVETGEHFVLLTQAACPIRYKPDQPPSEEDTADGTREYIDCNDLAQMLDVFHELELDPNFDGDWESLDLSWGELEEEGEGELEDDGYYEDYDAEDDDGDSWAHANELDGGLGDESFGGDWSAPA
ncbi:hypothetical protein KFE25_004997 [Diacronema lutheri]|uniref:Uncharacterized protein n=1 Tax=Diacronema lutheri TaxID=2081491 RepID=A0A8J5XDB9_DIALT|nr:hypothetical protein KFE25_004997 [Diacronema lutheri]